MREVVPDPCTYVITYFTNTPAVETIATMNVETGPKF
jgi:hypothetical protein